MTAERARILEMVAAGRLTVEQADQLLDALGDGAPVPRPAAGERGEVGRQQRGRPRVTLRATGRRPRRNELVGQLVAMGASVAYLRQLDEAGLLDEVPPDLLVSLTAVKGDVGYIRALRDGGLIEALPRDLLMALTAISGDVDILRQIREFGLADLPHDLLTALVAGGSTPAEMREMRDMGLLNLPKDVLLPLLHMGAKGTYIKELCDAGLLDLLQDQQDDRPDEDAAEVAETGRA